MFGELCFWPVDLKCKMCCVTVILDRIWEVEL